jgi:hypothetical protein
MCGFWVNKKGGTMKKCFVCYALLLLCAAGCSAKGGFEQAPAADVYQFSKSMNGSQTQYEVSRAEAAGFFSEPDSTENQAIYSGEAERKLVKRANISIRVEDLNAADALINALMAQHGAYAASMDTSENYRSYIIRVPHSAYNSFFTGMGSMGRTLRRSENAEDVTLRYYDLEGRLATKQQLLKTFQSYLGKAKDIEEILSVETRIADLQNEIDGTGKELRSLANMVDYATIYLELSGPVTAASLSEPLLPERIKKLFGGFGSFFSAVAVTLIGIVIYGVPLLLLAALLFWLLFGRIGLLKKLIYLAAGRRASGKKSDGNTKL